MDKQFQNRQLAVEDIIKDTFDRLNDNNDELNDDLTNFYNHVAGTDGLHDSLNLTDSSNWNVSKVKDALNAAKAAIDAIEAGDSNAAIGVYKDVVGGSVNAYTFAYTDLTLFNELLLLCRFDTPNSGPATITVESEATKDINIKDKNGNLQELTGGELNGWVYLIYDLSEDVFLALLDVPTSSAEDSETASIIDLDTSVVYNGIGITKLEIEGVTTVNLLDDDVAGCESTSGWITVGSSVAIDSSNKLEGTNCLKITVASDGTRYICRDIISSLDITKYYLITAEAKNEDLTTGMKIRLDTDDEDTTSGYTTDTTYTRHGIIIQPTDIDTATYARLRVYAAGLTGEYGFVDAIMAQEITAADYALGADAVMAKHPYHRGLKGTIDRRIKCEGKNLFDESTVKYNSYINYNTGDEVSISTLDSSDYIIVDSNTGYYLTGGATGGSVIGMAFYDLKFTYISGLSQATGLTSFTTPINAKYLRYTITNIGTSQLELGNTATAYGEYKASQANLPRILHSVPDGTKDKWDVKSGVVTQNISDVYTLQSGDIESVTTGTNVQYCRIDLSAFSGIKAQAAGAIDGTTLISGLKGEVQNLDQPGDENTWTTTSVKLYIQVALGTWADLAAARTALTSTVVTQIVYALATPITHEYPANAMNAYKSGRIIQEGAVTFFAKPATGVITIPNSTDETYYIGTIESVQEQQDDGSFVDYEVSTNDDTTITLVAGYDDTKIYKVVYFPVFNTTLGDITYQYPIDQAQAILNSAQNTADLSKAVNEQTSFTLAYLLDLEERVDALENP
jgi:hypothetical protein